MKTRIPFSKKKNFFFFNWDSESGLVFSLVIGWWHISPFHLFLLVLSDYYADDWLDRQFFSLSLPQPGMYGCRYKHLASDHVLLDPMFSFICFSSPSVKWVAALDTRYRRVSHENIQHFQIK